MAFVEDNIPKSIIARACNVYASGKVGLRDAANYIKVLRKGKRVAISAMTMAAILRRRGFEVRESRRAARSKPPAVVAPPLNPVEASQTAAPLPIAPAEAAVAVPWSIGEDAPAPFLPSAPAPEQPPVLDVGGDTSPISLPTDEEDDAEDTKTTRKKFWIPDALHVALRNVGSSFGSNNRLDLDPALPPREVDRIEWQASHSWRRMLIACLWMEDIEDSKWDPLPVARRLLKLIHEAEPPEEHADAVRRYSDWAENTFARRNERRGAQHGLYAVFTYAARAVRELDPERSFATSDRVICTLFRQEIPDPPPGFRSVGT